MKKHCLSIWGAKFAQIGRMSFVSVSTFALMGCFAGGDKEEMVFKPGTIHVEARQEQLADNVASVDETTRELTDRFNALERLYVELARSNQIIQKDVQALQSQVGTVRNTSATATALSNVSENLEKLEEALQNVEQRLFTVEVKSTSLEVESSENVPGDGGRQASLTPSKNSVPAASEAEVAPVMYGVHLGSYRSREQIPGSWEAFTRVFAEELGGLSAKVYVQSQQGIGDFLRLIAGPVASTAQAEEVCAVIKKRAREQFCVATPFQGDPLP